MVCPGRSPITPVLGFVIPLVARARAADWNLACRLCRRTLNSVLNQTDPRWVAFVVGHERPDHWPDDARVRFVRADLPVPETTERRFLDQKLKVKLGMMALRDIEPDFAMRLDADDLVSRRLVALAAEAPPEHGWYMRDGYVYQEGSEALFLRRRFYTRCASSHVLRLAPGDLPESMDAPDRDYLVDFWQHLRLRDTMRRLGRPLARFPGAGAVYVIGNAGSMMGHSLGNWRSVKERAWKAVFRRRLTSELKTEFALTGLDEIGRADGTVSPAH